MEKAGEVCGVRAFSEGEKKAVCYFVAEGYNCERDSSSLEGIASCEGVVVDFPCEVIYIRRPTTGKSLLKSASVLIFSSSRKHTWFAGSAHVSL